MILLLGYLAALFSTFTASAAVLSIILAVTTASKVHSHPHRSHIAQLGQHEPDKHRSIARISRATVRDRSASSWQPFDGWLSASETD